MTDAVTGLVEAGFTAVKMNACGRMNRLATTRDIDDLVGRRPRTEVLGADRDSPSTSTGVSRWPTRGRCCRTWRPFNPLFAEEVVLPEYTPRWRTWWPVPRCPSPPVSGCTPGTDALPALQAGIAVLQPDLSHAGGISEVRRIAALAETFDVSVAPHCPLGPVSLASSLQDRLQHF
ncbi:hypothetical protein LV779_35525 [Streptomyces thinghirensis]|nr:hypothetical protein [Streptomyces thinghirensis]